MNIMYVYSFLLGFVLATWISYFIHKFERKLEQKSITIVRPSEHAKAPFKKG